MPATAGRVRMPHNNRMSTSASLKSTPIWQKAIGHDPYAGSNEKDDPAAEEAGKEKARQVMALAREQNLTDNANRDDFARKLYLGLKGGKRRRADLEASKDDDEKQKLAEILKADDSSSEDEFIEEELEEKRKSSKKRKKDKKRKRRKHSSDEDSSSTEDTERRERRRRRKEKRRKKKRRRKHRDSSSPVSSDDESDRDRRRKRKRHDDRRRKDDNYKSSKDKRDGRGDEKPSMKEPFIESNKFAGSKKGYVFRAGENGVGYYVDKKPKASLKELNEMLKLYKDD